MGVMGIMADGVPTWHCLCVASAMKSVPLLEPAAMTTIFAVVGERRDDPLELLLLGDDGQHYAYPLPDGPMIPVEPDAGWVVDRAVPPVDELLA
jgi:hypothetical protein